MQNKPDLIISIVLAYWLGATLQVCFTRTCLTKHFSPSRTCRVQPKFIEIISATTVKAWKMLKRSQLLFSCTM
jgi:hypothetical protein